MKDNRWTIRCIEWQQGTGKRSRGQPSRRWQDDITRKEETTWNVKATDRGQWKALIEGYILQWMDKAYMKDYIIRDVRRPMVSETTVKHIS